MPVLPETAIPAICPVAAIQVEAVPCTCKWDMGWDFLSPVMEADGPIEVAKQEVAMTPQLMTGQLKVHAGHTGLADKGYTMYSFRSRFRRIPRVSRKGVRLFRLYGVSFGSRKAWRVDTSEKARHQGRRVLITLRRNTLCHLARAKLIAVFLEVVQADHITVNSNSLGPKT